jgi:dolichol-phosphate mannosyltransferase
MAEIVLIVLPTYNEAGNIKALLKQIYEQPYKAAGYELGVIVVDDNSPDGTAGIVKALQPLYPNLTLLVNAVRRGRGISGIQGFQEALRRGADYIMEMDADGSHPPSFILPLLQELKQADIVIGSRYLRGSKNLRRSRLRNLMSRLARVYLNFCLSSRLSDPASGYRAFTRQALERIQPKNLQARDPFIVTEILGQALKLKLKIQEVPIIFAEREEGRSKLSLSILLSYLWRAAKLKFKR